MPRGGLARARVLHDGENDIKYKQLSLLHAVRFCATATREKYYFHYIRSHHPFADFIRQTYYRHGESARVHVPAVHDSSVINLTRVHAHNTYTDTDTRSVRTPDRVTVSAGHTIAETMAIDTSYRRDYRGPSLNVYTHAHTQDRVWADIAENAGFVRTKTGFRKANFSFSSCRTRVGRTIYETDNVKRVQRTSGAAWTENKGRMRRLRWTTSGGEWIRNEPSVAWALFRWWIRTDWGDCRTRCKGQTNRKR